MDIVKITESTVRKGLRWLKSLYSADTHESIQLAPFGDDSCPLSGTKGIKARTSTDAYHVILGYFNRSNVAGEGEKRLYSVKSDGSISFYVHLKNDGTIVIGGEDDNLVRYSKLKEGFDQLKSDFNTFKATHTHTGVTTGSGVSGIPSDVAPSEADISGCKIDEIKTI